MALFADEELVERRRMLQSRKPKPNEIRDVAIAPGTATAVQAGSVGAQGVRPGSIPSGSINGVTIKAGTITASHIKARSITAEKIVVGTLTAVEIHARTITANEIVAGTITANEIQARSITADRIVAGSITANEIFSHTITADQIFAGTITATEIHAGAITAGKIATGGVIAGNLASGSVLAGTVVAGAVTANLIGAGQIAAVLIDIVSSGQLRAVDSLGKVRATMDAAGFTVYGPDGTTVWMSPSNGLLTPGIASGAVGPVQIVDGGVGTAEIAAFAVAAGKIAANAVAANELAANTIVAAHILAQKITGINVYASGFSNSESDAAKKFVLDTNGIHIRTSNNATSAYQYLDFFDGGFATRAWLCYDYFSGFDQLRLGMVSKMVINATRLDVETSARIAGVCRIVGGATAGEFQVEGSQGGMYCAVRMRAAAAGHWYGCGMQFRGRRVDGGGAGAAPSTVSITQTLQNSQITSVDYASITSYGVMFSVVSSAVGDCFYGAHFATN